MALHDIIRGKAGDSPEYRTSVSPNRYFARERRRARFSTSGRFAVVADVVLHHT